MLRAGLAGVVALFTLPFVTIPVKPEGAFVNASISVKEREVGEATIATGAGAATFLGTGLALVVA